MQLCYLCAFQVIIPQLMTKLVHYFGFQFGATLKPLSDGNIGITMTR